MGTDGLIAWLTHELDERNLSQSEASRRAGLSLNAISEIMNGKKPGLRVSRALADFFGVSPEYVFRLVGHLPPAIDNDLSPEVLADLDQIRRYVAMLGPNARPRLTEQLVAIAKMATDLSEADQDEDAA